MANRSRYYQSICPIKLDGIEDCKIPKQIEADGIGNMESNEENSVKPFWKVCKSITKIRGN